MNRSRLQSSVGLGNPGLLTPDRAGSVLLDEPAVEQGPLMEEDRSSTDSEDSEEEVSAIKLFLKLKPDFDTFKLLSLSLKQILKKYFCHLRNKGPVV